MPKPLTTADLPEDLAQFAESRMKAGLSASVEDAFRAGAAALAELQERSDTSLANLRAAIDEGDTSGIAEDSSLEGVLAELRSRRRHSALPLR